MPILYGDGLKAAKLRWAFSLRAHCQQQLVVLLLLAKRRNYTGLIGYEQLEALFIAARFALEKAEV